MCTSNRFTWDRVKMKKVPFAFFVIPILLVCYLSGCGGIPLFCKYESCLSLLSICRTYMPFSDDDFFDFRDRLFDIQFYTGEPFSLTRELSEREKTVGFISHRIVEKKEKRYMEIVFKKFTPGVLKKIDGDTLFIQFESIDDGLERMIPFTRDLVDVEGKGPSFVYRLRADRIVYEGVPYNVMFTQADYLVKKEDVSVYADETNEKKGDHFVKKPVYPVLMVGSYDLSSKKRLKRKASGKKIDNP